MEHPEEYMRLMHAMQSGIAAMQSLGDTSFTPKHLRVGINSCLVNQSAVVALLIEKGVFTMDEYTKAVVDATQTEVTRYEEELSNMTGKTITLI